MTEKARGTLPAPKLPMYNTILYEAIISTCRNDAENKNELSTSQQNHAFISSVRSAFLVYIYSKLKNYRYQSHLSLLLFIIDCDRKDYGVSNLRLLCGAECAGTH